MSAGFLEIDGLDRLRDEYQAVLRALRPALAAAGDDRDEAAAALLDACIRLDVLVWSDIDEGLQVPDAATDARFHIYVAAAALTLGGQFGENPKLPALLDELRKFALSEEDQDD